MPDVADYDNQEDWMEACVPTRIEEGDEQDQAVAVCISIWENRNKAMDNALKAISKTDDELVVGNYIVLFGGRDLEGIVPGTTEVFWTNPDGSRGEYFTPETDVSSPYTKAGTFAVDFQHGAGREALGVGPGPEDILGYVDWKTARKDEHGIFVQRVLDLHNQYAKWVSELIDLGIIGSSSQAMPKGVIKGDDGSILKWPLERDTLAVTPMEPRMISQFGDNALTAFKALGIKIPAPDDTTKPEPEPTEATPKAASAAVVAVGKARAHLSIHKATLGGRDR